jgi:hypothetical protein
LAGGDAGLDALADKIGIELGECRHHFLALDTVGPGIGGFLLEQALTSLALIFAVFLTNPAPVCVLDKVDAPLDDANVDRFCTLLGEIADTTGTRFLVVTHHRITMARVDRLFGVTVAERGVSQLVSVDLAHAVGCGKPPEPGKGPNQTAPPSVSGL